MRRQQLVLCAISFLGVVFAPPVLASELTLPLPTQTDLLGVIKSSITKSQISTDILGRVAAEKDENKPDPEIEAALNSCSRPREQAITALGPPPTCNETEEAKLEAFMTANQECAIPGNTSTYRIFVRNVGKGTADSVVWNFEPAGMVIVGEASGTLPDLPPGGKAEIHITIEVPPGVTSVDASFSISYSDCKTRKKVYACEVGTWCDCMANPRPVCEEHCKPTLNSCLASCKREELAGRGDPGCAATCNNNYNQCMTSCLADPSPICVQKAKSQCQINKGAGTHLLINGDCSPPPAFSERPVQGEPVIICDPSEIGCISSTPSFSLGPRFASADNIVARLGARFAEAIADISPGECSVIPDNVIVTPEFHDAYLRRGQPAAPYMRPLYENDQLFIRLVLGLELTGIQHSAVVRQAYGNLLDPFWSKLVKLVQQAQESGTTAGLLETYDTMVDQIFKDLPGVQGVLSKNYDTLQTKRKNELTLTMCKQARDEFDAAKCLAVVNAKAAIFDACSVEGDGGLAATLPGVMATYDSMLMNRTEAYPETQEKARLRLEVALADLRGSLKQAIQDKTQLPQLLRHIESEKSLVLEELLTIYRSHLATDKQGGTSVRLNSWGPAADGPKTVATQCMYDRTAGPRVELSWCESDVHPEFIIREAPEPAKNKAKILAPPPLIGGGEEAVIAGNPTGDVCGGGPGDPFWATDCSCHCGEVVECGDTLALCEACTSITRHDIYVRHPLDTDAGDKYDELSRQECLRDSRNQDDPYF